MKTFEKYSMYGNYQMMCKKCVFKSFHWESIQGFQLRVRHWQSRHFTLNFLNFDYKNGGRVMGRKRFILCDVYLLRVSMQKVFTQLD